MKDQVIKVLYESFKTNEASFSVVIQDSRKEKRFKKLVEYSYELAKDQGKIYLSDDGTSAALVLDSNREKTTLKRIMWLLILLFRVIGRKRAKSITDRLKILKSSRPRPHIYIWYIGVLPGFQGEGSGSKILNQIKSDFSDRTIVLETTRKKNFNFYERNGFKRRKEMEINGMTFYQYILNE